jgi:rubrerythrin
MGMPPAKPKIEFACLGGCGEIRTIYEWVLKKWNGRCRKCSNKFNSQKPELRALRSKNMKAWVAEHGMPPQPKPEARLRGEKNPMYRGPKPKCPICDKTLSTFNSRYCSRHVGALTGGEKCWRWKGGVTPPEEKVRKSIEYKDWRKAVHENCGWQCQNCGVKGGRNQKIVADHIKPFSLFPELRFDVHNGRTLCGSCDQKLGWKEARDLPHGITQGWPLEQHYWREAV